MRALLSAAVVVLIGVAALTLAQPGKPTAVATR